jgi:hypothetical protein
MNKKEAQTFEVAEYSEKKELGIEDAHRAIVQIFKNIARDCPAHAVWGDITGDKLKIHYNVYTFAFPQQAQRIRDEAQQVFRETVKVIKQQFKEATGATLKLKEVPDLANDSVEKVSLNERYMYKAWRFYTLSF